MNCPLNLHMQLLFSGLSRNIPCRVDKVRRWRDSNFLNLCREILFPRFSYGNQVEIWFVAFSCLECFWKEQNITGLSTVQAGVSVGISNRWFVSESEFISPNHHFLVKEDHTLHAPRNMSDGYIFIQFPMKLRHSLAKIFILLISATDENALC